MTPTVSVARSWQPSVLLDAAAGWRALAEHMAVRVAEYAKATATADAAWAGDAAESARRRASTNMLRCITIESCVREVSVAAATAHDHLTAARNDVLATVQAAEEAGFVVGDDGAAVAASDRYADAAASEDPAGALATLQADAERRSTEIIRALTQLAHTDSELAQTLRRIGDTLLVDAGAAGSMTPDERRDWWESLTDQQKHTLLTDAPALIGGLDGLPARARDEANRARLELLVEEWSTTLAGHREALAELDARDPGGTTGPPTMTERRELVDRIEHAESRLRDLAAVRATTDGTDRLLLLLDTDSGAQTRAAVAVGDPDDADHVSVTTGGITTTATNSLGGMVAEGHLLREEAVAQLAAANRDRESVAVIAWLGYDAPQPADGVPGLGDVLSTRNAEQGAVDLNEFFRGLDAANGDRDANVSAFGHSYGSLTTSLALQHDPDHGVDNVVFYGSPGVAIDDPSITDALGLAPGAVHDMTGRYDPVANIPWFGTNPSEIAGVERLSTDPIVTSDGVVRDGADRHSDYARPDAHGNLRVSGYNLAAILADTGNEIESE